jgi:protein SCO1/2
MKRSLQLGAVLLTVVAAVLALRGGGTPPPVLGETPSFRLVSDQGKPFDSASLDGHAWLASFLFTSCPGPCPRLVERLKTLRREIPAASLAFVSFTVDPVVDTPAVLAAYKLKHTIGDADAWTFVTGPESDVLALVQRGFLTGVERGDPSGPDGAVTHGVRVALVDGEHRIRGFYATDDDAELERLKRDVSALD